MRLRRGGRGVRSRSWRLGIGRRAIGRMIGGEFVGGADGVEPGVGAVGVDVFVLG